MRAKVREGSRCAQKLTESEHITLNIIFFSLQLVLATLDYTSFWPYRSHYSAVADVTWPWERTHVSWVKTAETKLRTSRLTQHSSATCPARPSGRSTVPAARECCRTQPRPTYPRPRSIVTNVRTTYRLLRRHFMANITRCASLPANCTLACLQAIKLVPGLVGVRRIAISAPVGLSVCPLAYPNKTSAVADKRRHASVRLFVICSTVMAQFVS